MSDTIRVGGRRSAMGAGSVALMTGLMLAVPPLRADEPSPVVRLADAISAAPRTSRSSPQTLASTRTPAPARPTAPMGSTPSVLFSADFDADCSQDPPAPPPSPPDPYPAPLGFTTYNVDMLTPSAGVAYVTSAWIVREDFSFNVNDCVMFSTSWYSPAGTANDWAAFPTAAAGPIPVVAGTRLKWNAVTYDASYRDGYEVRYSTGGTAPADFLANPPLQTIAAEETTWIARELDLSSLAGQNIHLAFRNNSVDKFLLLIDDIVVEVQPPTDPVLDSLTQAPNGGYAKLPAFLGYGFDLEAGVSNGGSEAITGVEVDADILVDGTPVSSLASTPIGLASGQSQTVSLGGGLYDTPGLWTLDALVSANESDVIPVNSTLSLDMLEITINELTRSEGAASGALGIGAGNGGELGNDFQLPAPARLSAVRMSIINTDIEPPAPVDGDPGGDGVGDFSGQQLEVVLRSFTGAAPDALLATATVTVPPETAIGPVDLLAVFDPPVNLEAGRYLVAAVEPTEPEPLTLQLQNTVDRFTPGTVWIDWPTTPSGTWANVETFGASFARTFRLTAILEARVLAPDAVDDAFSVAEDQALTQTVADNDALSEDLPNVYTVSVAPDSGTLALEPDGDFVYTPDANFFGSDSFQYSLCDTSPDCDLAEVQIEVTSVDDAPVGVDDSYRFPMTIASSDSVAGNDTLSGDGGNVWTLDVPPASGTLVLQPNGDFTYTPAAMFSGLVTFQYSICDADGDCEPATAQIEILPLQIFAHGFEG